MSKFEMWSAEFRIQSTVANESDSASHVHRVTARLRPFQTSNSALQIPHSR
jgi:hypothetical protein